MLTTPSIRMVDKFPIIELVDLFVLLEFPINMLYYSSEGEQKNSQEECTTHKAYGCHLYEANWRMICPLGK